MSAFTPGPWRIGYPPPNGEQTIGTKNGLMVAVATTAAGTPTIENARLIAAAPELYDALQEAARVLSDLPSTNQAGTRTRAAWERAVAVLAKVDG